MSLVPLNTPKGAKIDPRGVIVRQRKAVWRSASHRTPQSPFWTAPAKRSDDGAFSRPRSPEEEKPGNFVQLLTHTKRLVPTDHLINTLL
jgi:hypothetical protein